MTRHIATAQAETFTNDFFADQFWVNAGPGQNSVEVLETIDVFEVNSVDYINSPTAVFIDLEKSVQHGGFAEGDVLNHIGTVYGSSHNDIIRGSDPFVTTDDGVQNDPGINDLE